MRNVLKRLLHNIALFVAYFSICSIGLSQTGGEKPNFIIIFADDLGYADLGCFGSTSIDTPNLDQMASEGIRFTDFFVASSICGPSRASLLTGRYPQRCGYSVHDGNLYPDKGVDPSEITIAESLKPQGYATACIGKWHLGDERKYMPLQQGFDQYFGTMGNFAPSGIVPVYEGNEVLDPEGDIRTITEDYTRRAIDFMAESQKRETPFFLYLSHNRPHGPNSPNPRFLNSEEKQWVQEPDSWRDPRLYAACVRELDWSTGEIRRALENLGIENNTLVVFASDNGPVRKHIEMYQSTGPLRGDKGSTFDGGQRVPAFAYWPGKVPAGMVCEKLVTSMDLMPTFTSLAGGDLPNDRVIDGRDIWPLMKGVPDADSPHEAAYYYNATNLQAVREGKWKLHLPRPEEGKPFWDNNNKRDRLALFDMESDVGEQRNQAANYPEVVERLLTTARKARAELGDWDRPGTDSPGWMSFTGDPRKRDRLKTTP